MLLDPDDDDAVAAVVMFADDTAVNSLLDFRVERMIREAWAKGLSPGD